MPASAGRIRNACNCFVRKPNPTIAPAHSTHRNLPDWMPRTVKYTARLISNTNRASGLLNRNINAATGVSARTPPASSAVLPENARRTVKYTNATVATPIRASGSRMLNELSPNRRTETSINHKLIGGLSTVIEFAESDDPKKNASQFDEPACAAAE